MNSKFFINDENDQKNGQGGENSSNTAARPSKPHRLHESKMMQSDLIENQKCSSIVSVKKSEKTSFKLKPDHKCLAKMDVIMVIEERRVQSSRRIGIVQGDNGSYAFFVWIADENISSNLTLETVIKININFNYKLVTLDPASWIIPSHGSDLSLVIEYGEKTTLVDDDRNFKCNLKSVKKSLTDQILLEYDPLISSSGTSSENDREKLKIEKNKSQIQFVLFYNEMTDKFVSTLQHVVSVSHRTFTESIDFEWTEQYSTAILNVQKLTNQTNRLLLSLDDDDLSTIKINKNQGFSGRKQKIIATESSATAIMENKPTIDHVVGDYGGNNDEDDDDGGGGGDDDGDGDGEPANKNPSNTKYHIDLLTGDIDVFEKVDKIDHPLSAKIDGSQTSRKTAIKTLDNDLILVEKLFASQTSDPFNQFISPESPDHFGIGRDGSGGSSLIANDYPFSDDSNREIQIQNATEERKNEYVRRVKYTLFIGTWNVNGQTMALTQAMRTHFLSIDKHGPDFYAIGFQELDLSKEAFLFNDNKREDYWLQVCQQSLHPDRNYILVKKIRLIGMMLLVFAAHEFGPHIKNVAAETVGTGILGKMGNKGGVAIRFDLHDTSICFVNCHLAAHVEQFERRNLDFREINSRLQFYQFKPIPKRICDHDQIYWFGDLNYRIMCLNSDQVKSLLENKEYEKLLSYDQLKQQMQSKNCFQGYIEGFIRHLPSYKYNPGTDQWDSSEKRRPPAWCDRILWRGENIEQTVYRSHPDLKDSDHKPVSALFESEVLQVDYALKRKVHEDVMKTLDKLENELLPQVSIDTTEINFGTVSFKDNVFRVLNLTNTGQSRIRFKFINKPNDDNFCKPWLRVTPNTGNIRVKEQITIVFEMNFDDPLTAYKFNYGIEKLSDTLVLSLIGGKDIFITISGDYKLSCFGCTMETLVRLQKPIASMSLMEFQQQFSSYKIECKMPLIAFKERISSKIMKTGEETDGSKPKLPIPKELYSLIDHLYRNGHVNINIFQSSGMENEFFIIRNALDSSCPDKIKNLSENSIAEALLLFLETLPEPVVPYCFFSRISRIYGNHSECRQIYNEMPEINRALFRYLMMFLQEMCNFSGSDKPLNKLYIAKLFGPILVREMPEYFREDGSKSTKNLTSSSSSSSSFMSLMSSSMQSPHQPSTGMTTVTASSLSIIPISASSSSAQLNDSRAHLDNLTPEQFFVNYFLNTNSW